MNKILSIAFAMMIVVSSYATTTFSLPNIPDTLTTKSQKANFLALHYWDNIDLNELILIGNEDISEQVFGNFIGIMPDVTNQQEALDAFARHITLNDATHICFMTIARKYLANPQSHTYNENLYIKILESVIAIETLSPAYRDKYNYILAQQLKNRIGSVATNFDYRLRNGKSGCLHDIESPYTLVFFSDPSCSTCTIAKENLYNSPTVSAKCAEGYLTILSVCIEGKTDKWIETPAPNGWIDACDYDCIIYDEELYDIPQLPTLYLLDNEHRVVLRDVQVEMIEHFFQKN